MEDGATVRGAYCIKVQDFWINGQPRTIGDLGLPLSEGIVDPRYWFLGPLLIKDALNRYPLMYGLGMGGLENPLPRMLSALGWSLAPVPFAFRFVRPTRCLRQLPRLRGTPPRRLFCDALAVTGASWAGARLFDLYNRARWPRVDSCEIEEVDRFGPWTDDVWRAAQGSYFFAAVRDQATMNTLYGDSRVFRCQFLKISRAGRALGWTMVLDTTVKDHRHFGDLRVGTLADGFARPEDVPAVIVRATRFLERRGVDLIVTNQSHRAWRAGLKTAGFLNGPSNFVLALSPPLATLVGPIEDRLGDYHVNRGDGDGPINL